MLKRIFFRAVVMLVIVAGGGAYLAYTKGIDLTALLGKAASVVRLGDFDLETLSIDSQSIEDGTRVLKAGGQRVYKWQDRDGGWHYTQVRPPPDALAVESMDLNPNQNVIAGMRTGPDGEAAAPAAVPDTPADALPDNPYSPETIQKLFEDARGLQEKLGERYQTQEQVIRGE